MSTDYAAGIDSSDIVMSYGEEVTWNVLPSVQFKAIRMLSEGFSESKTRTRPNEINASGQVAHAITTQQQAQGSFNFGLSYGTFDDFISAAIGSVAFPASVNINGVAGDISAVSATNRFTSTTTNKFNTISVGQWVRVGGFTNAANNGFFRVTARTTGATPYITVEGATLVDETPAGTAAAIRGSFIRNGAGVRTFYFQKKLAAALFLRYAGAFPSGMTLNGQVGGFTEGSFNFIVSSEESATSDASTGAVLDAPSGRVMDNISGFQAFAINGNVPSAVIQGYSLNVTKNNARSQYGIGSASAVGLGRGTLQVGGTLSLYFNNFTMYNYYKNETDLRISFRLQDSDGAAYIVTMPAVTLMNPQIVAGGPDTDLVAEFELEGNPAASTDTVYSGVTIQIDKLPVIA